MNAKRKGADYERKLVRIFYDAGFGVIRSPTSGGATSRHLPDIVAGNGKVYFAIEVKMKKELPIYIREEQFEELIDFAARFGAIPLIAVKLPHKEWKFIDALMLKKAEKNYKIDEELYRKGYDIKAILNWTSNLWVFADRPTEKVNKVSI